jgi:hypothetical protein
VHPLSKIAEWTNVLRSKSDEIANKQRIGMSREDLVAAQTAADQERERRASALRRKL